MLIGLLKRLSLFRRLTGAAACNLRLLVSEAYAFRNEHMSSFVTTQHCMSNSLLPNIRLKS